MGLEYVNWLALLFGFLFAAFRELMDHAKENGFKGYPDWWNTGEAWRNKHEWGPKYLPFLPTWLSTWLFKTVLVWLTDAEHFFQLFSLLAVLAALLAGGGTWVHVLNFYAGHAVLGALKPLTKLK